ncbi:hypothetical protein CC86DRAFT_462926 [Ophiobolus disseminans]|uniref:Uncharacterized protein n=1 Tax=Ophiobolus disseminans TaxID=1469910 RepID=A0A6A7AHD4_9PLEO|nr:hypothetical protein CC86DRAFT_462926 [Ophiobolus disseminans]
MASLAAQIRSVQLSAEVSALLSLPGERRNKIYALCTEPAVSLHDIKNIRIVDPIIGRIVPPQFLALTQTCKQLRAEFRPIYMNVNVGVIPLETLPDYLAAFDSSAHNGYDRLVIVYSDKLERDVRITAQITPSLHIPTVQWVSYQPETGHYSLL